MKLFFLPALLLIATLSNAQSVQKNEPLYFASYPALSPDAKTLYFCYEGDIWKVPAAGGNALRVTAMTGYETRPRVSPDGKWLAFSSNEQGNDNVYIVPVDGGLIRQLTCHDASDRMASWSADSKFVYFESNRYNGISTYKVSIDGGTPARLFGDYYNTIANLVESPADGSFYFNESTESYASPTRKKYKGDHNPNIKNWNPETRKYTEITDYNGKDIWPMVDKNGTLYWACDSENDVYNIAVLKNGKPQILTHFTEAILYPQVSFNGEKIAYLHNYRIALYDVASGKSATPDITLAANSEKEIEQLYNAENNVSNIAVSPDGLKLAFIARGRLFVSDAKGKFAQEMPTDSKERVVDVVWDKTSKNLYYTRSRKGWFNLYKMAANPYAKEEAVYTPDSFVQQLTSNHNNTKIAFFTGSTKLELLDVAAGAVSTLANVNEWAYSVPTIQFSHDDQWITFTGMSLFEPDIFVCNVNTKQLINLTNSASIESSPVWSADGKYLYFVANPVAASFPRGSGGTQLYRMALDRYDTPFATDKFKELFKETPEKTKEEAKPANEKDKNKKDEAKPVKENTTVKTPIVINPDNIYRRWEQLMYNGSQSNPMIFTQGGKTYLLYNSTHEGGRKLYKQEIVDFDRKPAEEVKNGGTLSNFSYNGKDLFAIGNGKIYKVDIAAGSVTDLGVQQSFTKRNTDEFEQMFYEVWAQLSENFYDPKFHGVDWKATQIYYASFLPFIKSRADLRTLITDLLGELNSSHLGFSSAGKEERAATAIQSFETGILFDQQQPFVVREILENTPADNKSIDIRKGDRLLAVNGLPVDEKENREKYFSSARAQSEITLRFERDGKPFDCTLHTFRSGELRNALYTQWEDQRRAMVNAKGNSRIAYIHMSDMGVGSLNKFLAEMNRDAVHKDALILDLRFNNGGNVHNDVIEFLMQKRYFTWGYRDQQRSAHPNVTPADKPLVVLINERSLSDAEVTSNGIKSLGVAKLIGTETYRWIIFTSGIGLVDGSFCRIPAWGCYNLKGEDMEAVGVAPDIYIKNTFEDRLLGRDPQLECGIEEILKMLK